MIGKNQVPTILFIIFILLSCGQSSAVYNGVQVNDGENTITLGVEGFESIKETTTMVSRSLVQQGFQIRKSNESAGFVQTQGREVSGTVADADIRLNAAVQNPNTIEISGEYFGPPMGVSGMVDSEHKWRSINFGAPSGSRGDQAWEAMVETAQRIGEIVRFSNRSL